MSRPQFARHTEVAPEKSRMEIEQTLKKYGASAFVYGEELGKVLLGFKVAASTAPDITLSIRMMVQLPSAAEFPAYDAARAPGHRNRSDNQRRNDLEQAKRQRWRALALIVKAKMEAVASGISTVEKEFMADIMVPGTGHTIGDQTFPALEAAYRDPSKPMPKLLGA